MTLLRGQILTTGPLALIAICYAIAGPASVTNHGVASLLPEASRVSHSAGEAVDCTKTAEQLAKKLPADWTVLISEPFVLAGDCRQDQLTKYFRDTISPTAQALSVQYFDTHPTWPITIILCSSDESYRECHHSLNERDRSEYAGIYSRAEHRVIVNIATGEGTLAHELTHALAHADFPDLPEWLDEWLASLYEECEFSSDGMRLIGAENWRGAALHGLVQRGELRSIVDLATEQFAAENAAVDYAQARYFCLYLQQRNLLEPFYRKCRSQAKADRTGLQALAECLNSNDLRSIDVQFQSWLRTSAPERSSL